MRRRPLSCCVPCVVILLAASAASAQTPQPSERVFATSVNNELVEISFSSLETSTAVPDAGSSLRGCAVRNDLRIVVANHNQQGSVKVFNSDGSGRGATITTAVGFPSGVTVDPVGNVFIANDNGPGGPDEVWRARRDFDNGCLDGADPAAPACAGGRGGYRDAELMDGPVVVDGIGSTVTLADVKAAGDSLYLLVQSPALLLKYHDPLGCRPSPTDPPCAKTTVVDTPHFQGLTPTGLAFTEEAILVTSAEGRILRFGLDGAPDGTFVDDVGGRAERIAVGIQAVGNLPITTRFAFVTVHSGTVIRYAIEGGAGVPSGTVSGLNNTVGVCIASGAAAITSAGSDQSVALNSVDATFESVLTSGLSDASCFSFLDPREDPASPLYCGGVGDGQPLACDLALDDSRQPGLPAEIVALGFENRIPGYVRAFSKVGEAQGTFRLCIAKTTAGFANLIDVHGDQELQWLGYDVHTRPDLVSCSGETTRRPRFFLSEEVPFDPLLEGRVFINNTSSCSSDGADAWNMNSLWLTGARDTRADDAPGVKVAESNSGSECNPAAGVGDCQLNRLKALLDSSTCIPSRARKAFVASLDKAIRDWDRGHYADAGSKLLSLEGTVAGSVFPASCGTLQAEIRGRAQAAAFTAGNAATPTQ